jgi:Ni/Fe-hydrogenase b-type cytochrome subunit
MSASATHDRAASQEPGYRWVYLWHWPIRAMHWVAAVSIAVLVVTGFYIGKPYFAPRPGETVDFFVMGSMRFLHFLAAGALVATAIVRVYWLFGGNRYERFGALFPFSRESLRNLLLTIRRYATMRWDVGPHFLGHNPLQQLSYTFLYLVILAQVVTGFALYGLSDPEGPFYRVIGVNAALFLGGVPYIRFLHHVLTWAVLIFIPLHIYFALRADFTDRSGSISSIVSGGRWVRDDVHYEDA